MSIQTSIKFEEFCRKKIQDFEEFLDEARPEYNAAYQDSNLVDNIMYELSAYGSWKTDDEPTDVEIYRTNTAQATRDAYERIETLNCVQ